MFDIHSSINTITEIYPKIYAYTTPDNISKKGWLKIGYTERSTKERIKEQTHTAGIKADLIWEHHAKFHDGGYFTDKDFHKYLVQNGIYKLKNLEWFNFYGDYDKSEKMFINFTYKKNFKEKEHSVYQLRKEQEKAVTQTIEYFNTHQNGEFLWNAKPRFGKTLSAYDLMIKLDVKNILIVTNRPAIANSWFDDFEKFIEWKTSFKFVSETDSLKNRSVISRQEFLDLPIEENGKKKRNLTFLSLQDLKGSKYFGGHYEKLKWVSDLKWDLLIVDESHEGVDTIKGDYAFDKIRRKNTLYLSGTPFKQIANEKFSQNQIYNWSYVDEQEAKMSYKKDTYNPYANLPKLNMFTYQLSNMIIDKLEGAGLEESDNVDYAFDLNEFFSTNEKGKFIYEDSVIKWLDTLTKNEKYPFSTPTLRKELKHTLWYLNRVDSAKALKKILENHPVFGNGNYEIVLAAGETIVDKNDDKYSLDKVKTAILNYDKTITLTVGQLITGVTIPEWSAVLMLNNVSSPSLYLQAAFRAQNPYEKIEIDNLGHEKVYRKENAYIFDFAPERTLTIVDMFANNLSKSTINGYGTSEQRNKNISDLLNFFPVIGEDSEGRMIELDAEKVLTIPKTIKSKEVVRRGFMSNLLFANISGIFQYPKVVVDILNKFEKTEEGKVLSKNTEINPEDLVNIEVDENNEVIVDNEIVINKSDYLFVKKQYDYNLDLQSEIVKDEFAENLKNIVAETISNIPMDNVKEEYNLTDKEVEKIKKNREKSSEIKAEIIAKDIEIERAKIKQNLDSKLKQTVSEEEKNLIKEEYQKEEQKIIEEAKNKIETLFHKDIEEINRNTIEELEIKKKEKEKLSIEDDIRSRLRGFSRSIPSFIMAYGDENLTLENFDKYTPEKVFEEVTGITLEQFIFLRDGGNYIDEKDGIKKHFYGQLFDSIVFNQSIKEFLKKRNELSNYFEDNKEDIFDYIPNQQTNQIFTPKKVVKMMVDQLETENPGIYDDSSKTFIDLYMKSGLYITEIVKKIYNSPIIIKEYPNEYDRLKHILENQVYGLAPSEIIYRISTRFIFGNLENISRKNFKMLDAYPYAKEGHLEEKLNEIFEK